MKYKPFFFFYVSFIMRDIKKLSKKLFIFFFYIKSFWKYFLNKYI